MFVMACGTPVYLILPTTKKKKKEKKKNEKGKEAFMYL